MLARIVIVLFAGGQVLAIAYYMLSSGEELTCSGPGFADGCDGGAVALLTAVSLCYVGALLAICFYNIRDISRYFARRQ
jgi:hypothetical protein